MFPLTTTDIPSLFEDMDFPLATPRRQWKKSSNKYQRSLTMDMVENDKQYTALFNIPGANKQDVDVSVEGQRLSVSLERNDEHKEGSNGLKVHWRERQVGTISRTIQLPNDVDMNSIEAKQDNGVLKIRFSKKNQKRKILVN